MVRAILVVGILLAAAPLASAGFLASDPGAIPGFVGTQAFSSDGMAANVDYAVFAPGDYPDDGILGNDPSNGAEYVYAYQVFTTGTKPVTILTVGIAVPATVAATDPLHADTGGIAPTSWNPLSTSVVATFFAPELQSPMYSQVLLFTSPNAPTFGPASVGDGGRSDQRTLPTPVVPEPAGLAMGALMAGALLRRWR